MQVTDFQIDFNSFGKIYPADVCFPGDTISGNVRFKVAEPFEAECVVLVVKGKSKVKFRKYGELMHGKVKYFQKEIVLMGRGNCDTTQEIRAFLDVGEHKLPFCFEIPGNLPSSFDMYSGSSQASIRYYVKCKIKSSGKGKCAKIARALTMLHLVDLNKDDNATNVLNMEETKSNCCLCCQSGPLKVDLHMDRLGFVPGEAVVFSINVSNDLDIPVTSICVSLKLLIRMHAREINSSSWEEMIVFKDFTERIEPGCKFSGSNERFVVPPCPPTCHFTTSNIELDYAVNVYVVTDDYDCTLEFSSPVIIGNVPLRKLYTLPGNFERFSPVLHTETSGSMPFRCEEIVTSQPDALPLAPRPVLREFLKRGSYGETYRYMYLDFSSQQQERL